LFFDLLSTAICFDAVTQRVESPHTRFMAFYLPSRMVWFYLGTKKTKTSKEEYRTSLEASKENLLEISCSPFTSATRLSRKPMMPDLESSGILPRLDPWLSAPPSRMVWLFGYCFYTYYKRIIIANVVLVN